MRTTWVRRVWLWFACVYFGLPTVGQLSQVVVWKGATVGWSPLVAVGSVEQTDDWDVAGWLRDGEAQYHEALRASEVRMFTELDKLLATVYVWRDEVLV